MTIENLFRRKALSLSDFSQNTTPLNEVKISLHGSNASLSIELEI